MTMLTIDTNDARTVKAIEIAAEAGQWLKVRDRDGRPLAFGVPSQRHPSHYYLVTTSSCQCVDFKRRQQPCKHIAAVALHVALCRAGSSKRGRLSVIRPAAA